MSLSEKIAPGQFPILVSLPRNDIELARAALDAGADGIKVHLNAHHHASGTNFGDFASERKFLETLARLPTSKLIMIGQEKLPSDEELLALSQMGFEGFNLYLKHAEPRLFASPLRPILALEHGYQLENIHQITAHPNAWIEASIVNSRDYGTHLTADDLSHYLDISAHSKRPVIIPTQKKVALSDLSKLKEAGASALLIGVIVMGSTTDTVAKTITSFVKAR
jgi:hypothetical protein